MQVIPYVRNNLVYISESVGHFPCFVNGEWQWEYNNQIGVVVDVSCYQFHSGKPIQLESRGRTKVLGS
jgi:hypothetical protein